MMNIKKILIILVLILVFVLSVVVNFHLSIAGEMHQSWQEIFAMHQWVVHSDPPRSILNPLAKITIHAMDAKEQKFPIVVCMASEEGTGLSLRMLIIQIHPKVVDPDCAKEARIVVLVETDSSATPDSEMIGDVVLIMTDVASQERWYVIEVRWWDGKRKNIWACQRPMLLMPGEEIPNSLW